MSDTAPKRKGCLHNLGVIALGFIIVVTIVVIIQETVKTKQTPAEKAAHEKESARIALSAIGLKELRSGMRNPDAFKLDQVIVMEDGASCYHYRAQNGFGGMNVGRAVFSPQGRLETNETQGFRVLWNKECANKSGVNETWSVANLVGLRGILSGDK